MYGLLDDRFMKVVAMPDAGAAIEIVGRSPKHPLPAPLAVRVRVFSDQRVGQRRQPQAARQIGFVLPPHVPQVFL